MESSINGLPLEIAGRIHPDWRKNEAEYGAQRDGLLSQYADRRVGFAEGKVIRRGRIIFLLAYIIILSSVEVSFTLSSRAQSSGQATVIVKITGLRSDKGQVKIAVFNSAEKWLGEQTVYSSTIDVDSLSVTWKINDVPNGDYGIAVFHDENKNGKMDKNFLGIPQEPYGFSNNMRVILGPPKWDKSKFAVKGPTTEVTIEVK